MRNVRNSAGKSDGARGVSVFRAILERCAFPSSRPPPSSGGFTLVEMMVVIAVIGILIGGVFKLLSAAGTGTKRSETVARLERIQNALSGFYAEFGTYPPVLQHHSPDPFMEEEEDGSTSSVGSLTAVNANLAAHCQPTGFLYPTVKSQDEYINVKFEEKGLTSANEALGANAASRTEWEWKDVRVFQFGLMSFLMPRIEMMGGEEMVKMKPDSESIPDINFFKSRQWLKNNTGSLKSQRDRENHAVARWLVNLEKLLVGGPTLMGVDTRDPDPGATMDEYSEQKDPKTGTGYVLGQLTAVDGWGNEFYYHSMPPYQSYRIWSAGPNGVTFPPWISLEGLSTKDRLTVTQWTKDDIARFDRSK